jgi:hypothetical protein
MPSRIGAWALPAIVFLLLRPAAHAAPRIDRFGDPLPEGCLYRLGSLRLRHPMVTHLSFSANDIRLNSIGWTPDRLTWDVRTGRLLSRVTFPGGHAPDHLTASPDGRFLAGSDRGPGAARPPAAALMRPERSGAGAFRRCYWL